MLTTALVVALAAVVATGAPSPARSVGGVPIVDTYIPFSGKIPRTSSKYPQVNVRGSSHISGEGQGNQVAFDAPDGGSQYTLNLTIAGESYNLIFDTGSSDLWLPASNFSCLSAYNPEVLANYTQEPQAFCEFGPHLFDASTLDQLTPVNFTNNFNISYGVQGYSDLQFATGSSYTGAVTIGNVTVPHAHINIVYDAEFFGNGISDGLIGFAGPGLTSLFATANPLNDSADNFEPYLPWFYQAVQDNVVQAPYYSIAINRPSFEAQEGNSTINDLGYLVLGGLPSCIPLTGKHITVPNQNYTELINGKNVSVPAWLTTTVDEWVFPGSESLNTTTQSIILDSGTFNVYAPNAVAEAYANAFVPAGVFNETAGGYMVPCTARIPPLSVRIGGVSFPFDEQDLIFPADDTGVNCISSVTQGGNSTSDIYILGDKFLNSVVAAFNVGKNEISIFERVAY